MTQVERLARELAGVAGYSFDPKMDFDIEQPSSKAWLALAKHVLSRERRARGRTVGYGQRVGMEWDVLAQTGGARRLRIGYATRSYRPIADVKIVRVPRKRGGK